MDLSTCLASCEAMIRKGSSSFHSAFSLLPSPRKEAVFVIYAFCRMIDDSVDEPERSHYTIDELERHLIGLDEAAGHFIWPSLRWLFDHFPLSKDPFFKQMEGQRRDLVVTHYTSMEQLEEYCYLVAGTVGEMLLPVLHDHPSAPSVIESGIYLGKAMQIVNIVRDIGEDKARGRRYLPEQLMLRHGYNESAFMEGKVDAAFQGMIQELDELANRWFNYGLRDLNSYAKESAFSVELAARFYMEILNVVKKERYQVYAQRTFVGPIAKMRIYAEVKRKHSWLNNPGAIAAVSQ
ncbi:phytoene/squalene synthase family protein [Paenibacillus sp. NPDC058174]|uniref:phytoene/squalene synthase family protein n=1 Tax=Paenibacillus sp. NPDC058174 TaxID=3346366 RepID=UPI0036DE3229